MVPDTVEAWIKCGRDIHPGSQQNHHCFKRYHMMGTRIHLLDNQYEETSRAWKAWERHVMSVFWRTERHRKQGGTSRLIQKNETLSARRRVLPQLLLAVGWVSFLGLLDWCHTFLLHLWRCSWNFLCFFGHVGGLLTADQVLLMLWMSGHLFCHSLSKPNQEKFFTFKSPATRLYAPG